MTSEADLSSSVVIFTGGPAVDMQVLLFAARLRQQPGIRLLAIISESPIRGIRGKIQDLWQRRGLLAPAMLMRDTLAKGLTAVLAPATILQRRRLLNEFSDLLHFVDDIHAVGTIRLIQGLQPALGLVYGGPILRPELFSVPRLGTLGIHHGKVPHYRGKKTTFWAMYNGETDVGVVIQKIGSNLDAGDIVMKADLPVGSRSLPRVRKELDRIGIDLYVRSAVAVLNGKAVYASQPVSTAQIYKDPKLRDIVMFWGKYLVRLITRKR